MIIPTCTQQYSKICNQFYWGVSGAVGGTDLCPKLQLIQTQIWGTLQLCNLAVTIFQRFLYCFHVKIIIFCCWHVEDSIKIGLFYAVWTPKLVTSLPPQMPNDLHARIHGNSIKRLLPPSPGQFAMGAADLDWVWCLWSRMGAFLEVRLESKKGYFLEQLNHGWANIHPSIIKWICHLEDLRYL